MSAADTYGASEGLPAYLTICGEVPMGRAADLAVGSGEAARVHTVGLVARLCDEVVVVLNDPQEWAGLPARLTPDVYPDGGALGGIYSGLLAASRDYALVVACDMPFLSHDLLAAMLARPRDYDALVPRSPAAGTTRNALDVEPLHAIYAKACLAPMRATLESGRRQIAAFFSQVRVAYVEPDEIRPPPHVVEEDLEDVEEDPRVAEVEVDLVAREGSRSRASRRALFPVRRARCSPGSSTRSPTRS